MVMKSNVWLLAALYFGGAIDATTSSDYPEAILSSGTVKLGDWQDAFDKASNFVASLSNAEKLSIVTGDGAKNFTGTQGLDSSSNPLNYYFVTAWPAGLAMSMTWDKDAINRMGQGLGAEFKAKGIDVAYAPTVQPLGRSAWGGRSGETYGPDSYLSGFMAGELVRGMVASGVTPSSKHFILNEQETNRMGGGGSFAMRRRSDGNSTLSSSTQAYSVEVGDKAFHETYLAPFYDVVKAGVGATMCSMQRINGTYSCEDQDTISRYLKVEIGFPGYVHPDEGAQRNALPSANAGLDYGSSTYWNNSTIIAAIANGTFSSERFDDMVIRQMMGYYKHNQENYPNHAGYEDDIDVRGKHGDMARQYAADSIVLLKNTNNALPLKNRKAISIFGFHAAPRLMGPNTALSVLTGVGPTMDGHMTQNGGSAMSSAGFLVTPFQAFNERAQADGFMLKWWLNNTVVESSGGGIKLSVSDGAGTEISETTLGIADGADACVVFLNAWAGEGADRPELTNAEGDQAQSLTYNCLVKTIADNCNNTIVVVNTIGPRLLDQWATHENVTGILYGGPLGQSSGHAINDVLFGDVNPSGKLVHTVAKNESDYDPNTRISEELTIYFSEGNYIDYKYFDLKNITPRYEFGYGLSYTTFEYGKNVSVTSKAQLLSNEFASGDLSVGGREDLWDIVAEVSTDITNAGKFAGAEVAQLYVEFPAAANEPVRQLRGFHKLKMQPGKTKKACFQLMRRDLSVWNVEKQEWQLVRGDYKFNVGSSSRDLRVNGTMTV